MVYIIPQTGYLTCMDAQKNIRLPGMKKILKHKSFYISVLVIAVPMMLQSLITSSVNLVDNLMVGVLGDAAIGSVAAVNRYYMIADFAAMGLANAGAVFIAQYYGAEQYNHMKESFRTMLVYSLLIMMVFAAIGLLFPAYILRFFTADEAIIQEGVRYLSVAAWSFIPTAVMLPVYSSMRAVGETKVPLYCSMVSILTNTFLNYCFIFGHFGFPRLEVQGAALGTLLARLIELVICLAVLKKGDYVFSTSMKELFSIPKNIMIRVLSKAAPLMLNETLWSAGMAMLFKLYSTRGVDVMSGYSIAGTIGDLFFTLFSGMAAAATVVISTPLGAGKLDEARANAYRLLGFSMVLAVLFGGLICLSRGLVPLLYVNVSPAAQKVARDVLLIQALLFWIYMGTAQCYFTLRAGGDMRHTLLMDSGFMWVFNIPVVALVAYGTNLPYLWPYVAGQLTDFVKLAFAYRLIRREKWLVNLTKQ